MGYIIVAALLVFFVVFIGIAIFSAVSPTRGTPSGQSAIHDGDMPDPGHPLSRTQPAADEPTPGASDTATPDEVQRAQRRVPPA